MRRSIVRLVRRAAPVAERRSPELGMIDELTGLYNENSLLFLGSYHAKLAQRTGHPFALIHVEVIDLETGPRMSSPEATWRVIADLLVTTFRSSDVCARLEGRAFAVLLAEATRGRVGPQIARLRLLERHEARGLFSAGIVLRTGVAGFDPASDESFEELLAQARANTKTMSATVARKWAKELATSPDERRLLAARQPTGAARNVPSPARRPSP